MTQISRGQTFADGQVVNYQRLNDHVDLAELQNGAIAEQTLFGSEGTPQTVASDDLLMVSDVTAVELKSASVTQVLASNAPIVTSSITGGANSDIVTTPNDGTAVAGSTYTSADGLTVVVTTPAAHGLAVGQVVLITGAGSGYNGTFRLTVAAGSSFTYVMSVAATAGSGSLSYTKKGTSKVSGNLAVSQNLYVDGNVGGNATFEGNANFTGTLKINGIVGYLLTEVYEETLTPYLQTATGNYSAIWQSALFSKPADEIWVFELSFNYTWDTVTGAGTSVPFGYGVRYSSETAYTGTYKAAERFQLSSPTVQLSYSGTQSRVLTWVEQSATVLTSIRTVFDTCITASVGMKMFSATLPIFAGYPSTPVTASTFKIYKYRTA